MKTAEKEANQFAMALLIPENLLRGEVRKIGGIDLCDDKKVKELANKFEVPVALMAIRIGQVFGKELMKKDIAEIIDRQNRLQTPD